MQNAPQTYAVPDNLLQLIADNLAEQPARVSRGLLNAIEKLCMEQDQQRLQVMAEAQRDALRRELEAEHSKPAADAVHTSAPADPAPLPPIDTADENLPR